MINAQNFKISCSAIGKIMTSPKSKTAVLSETCKTYCKDWVTEQIYGRSKDFTSKQTDKGNKTEFDAVELLEGFYN